MNRKFELTDEQRLLLLTSRLTFSQNNDEELTDLMNQKIDWFELVKMAIKNKVFQLVYHNLCKKGYKNKIPSRIDQVGHFYEIGIRERNKVFFREFKTIIDAFKEQGICAIPLKGAYLIPNMYKEYGIRTINDIDCLVNRNNINNIRSIMSNLGYVQQCYDRGSNRLVPLSREKEILWKAKMNNLYPFRKLIDSDFCKIVAFDFCFSLDFNLKTETVDKMISSAEKVNEFETHLKPSHFFVHLCNHLFKEAVNVEWVALNGDMNLIKFCDVREYFLKFMSQENINEAIQFAKEHKLEKGIYFTVYYLKEIYCDGYEDSILNLLNIEDNEFLDTFGEREYGKSIKWKKSFWERLFSENNKDELIDKPKFLEI